MRTLGAVALAGALALGMLPAAHAGPDDGRYVATRGHVDAPKTYWQDGGFVLLHEAGETRPLEEAVNWVGKGWSTRGTSQYTFTLDDSPALKHLGKPGEVWYRAPALPWGNQDPIWAGFGADTDIPAETFRDATFSLDLLTVDGPGRMEMFNYFPNEYPTGFRPLLSSFRNGWQSSRLRPGSHTHNETVFSKPGRYELTYRTVARGTDGSVIASKPSTMVWQVGGMSPGSTPTIPTRERYDAAPVGSLKEAGYRFSATPKTEVVMDADEHLTTLSFDAEDPSLTGTLTLYIDGYFLTDLPVRDGKAAWDEMLGSYDSQLQAVFTPEGEEGARWVSPVLNHQPGESAAVNSSQGEGQWPQKLPVPENQPLETGTYSPKSTGYRIAVQNEEFDGVEYSKISVRFDDPKVRAFIGGGYYSDPEIEYPDSSVEGNTDAGEMTTYVEADEWLHGTTVTLKIMPHPEMNLQGMTVDLPKTFGPGYSYVGYGQMTRAEGGSHELEKVSAEQLSPTPIPAPEPSQPEPSRPAEPTQPEPSSEPSQPEPSSEPSSEPSQPSQSEPSQPETSQPSQPSPPEPRRCVSPELEGRALLDNGHVDLMAHQEETGNLSLSLKDETGQISRQKELRPLREVLLGVGDNARQKRTSTLMDPALDFLGEEGDVFYGLPMNQQEGRIWPGYNTTDIDYEKIDGPIRLRMTPEQMPENANFAMYQTDFLGESTVLMDSSVKDDSLDVAYPTHVHANWIFTKPGLYRFTTVYEARSRSGEMLSSEPQTLVFAVGDQVLSDCLQGAEETPAPGAPTESEQPKPTAPVESGQPTLPAESDQPNPTIPGESEQPTVPSESGQPTAPVESDQPQPAAPSESGQPEATEEDPSPSAPGGEESSGSGQPGGQESTALGSTPEPSDSSSAPTAPTQSQSGALGGALAHTGARVGALAGVGALCLLVGSLVLLRRRRSRLTS